MPADEFNMKKIAVGYAAAYGWRIFPVARLTKTPLTSNGFHDASTDIEQIHAWWERWPGANIGLACALSGIIAIDGDPCHYDDESYDMLDSLERVDTVVQSTPTSGQHWLFRLPENETLSNSNKGLPPGFDVRANGYILLPPSIVRYQGEDAVAKQTLDGYTARYEWMGGYGPDTAKIAALPKFLLERLRHKTERTIPPRVSTNGTAPNSRYAAAALEKELDELARTREGGRNIQLNNSAFNLGQLVAGGALDRQEVGDQLLRVALSIGLDEREAARTIRSGLSAGEKSPRGVPEEPKPRNLARNGAGDQETDESLSFADSPHNTDMGNARRMLAVVKDKVFYVPEFDRWYIWAETHWQEDTTLEIMRFAKQTVTQMYVEAAAVEDDDKRKHLIKWAIASEARQRLEAMISLLRSEPGIAIGPNKLDRHPMLLACKNGTLDLATGDLLEPNPCHYITRCLALNYNLDAECPLWEQFLLRIFGGNLELISFVQRLVGHALTGDATGKYLVFLYGAKGNNGKSTLVETIMRMLGLYALKSPTEMVMAKSYRGGIPNDIARLRGVRFTVTNEVDEGMTLSESIVKDLTGNDTLTARFMRAEYFDFTPTHKLWIYGNHKPEITGTDSAIWDRVKLIPFEIEIPEAERDPLLAERLAAELEGVLAWSVRGNLLWQHKGISAPITVKEATSAYRTEQDVTGEFLKECCDFGSTLEIAAGRLFQAYEAWCKHLGLKANTGTKFGSELRKRGFTMRHTRTGGMREGVNLNSYGQSFGPAVAVHWSDKN